MKFPPGGSRGVRDVEIAKGRMSALGQEMPFRHSQLDVRYAPCVDGPPLARAFLMFCPSVGAAMCAKTGPDQ